MRYSGKIEYAEARKIRERNTRLYRMAHLPIWIWVFFLAPGPLTFSLFAHGFSWGNAAWLAAVLIGTGIAGLRGQLPGVEPRPYILRFDEDKPNPLYRKVCYTFAWNAVLNFALLNLAGLAIAAVTGVWRMKQIYIYAYSPLCALILLLGMMGKLPRVRTLHQGRRHGAALLLRLGLGGDGGADAAAGAVEGAAGGDCPHQGRKPDQADRLCWRARHHGPGGVAGNAAADPAHFAGRADGVGLRP